MRRSSRQPAPQYVTGLLALALIASVVRAESELPIPSPSTSNASASREGGDVVPLSVAPPCSRRSYKKLIAAGVVTIGVAGALGYDVYQDWGLPWSDAETFKTLHVLDQKDPTFRLPCGGSNACGPAVAADSILWLSDHGYPDLLPSAANTPDLAARKKALIEHLSAAMRGQKVEGATPTEMERGLTELFQLAGYTAPKFIELGWEADFRKNAPYWPTQDHPADQGTPPDMERIVDAIRKGWPVFIVTSPYESMTYRKDQLPSLWVRETSSHWLLAAGYERKTSFLATDQTFLHVHNPSNREARSLEPQTAKAVAISRLSEGTILRSGRPIEKNARGENELNQIPARGHFILEETLPTSGLQRTLIRSALIMVPPEKK